MLDPRFVRQNPDVVRANLQKRGIEVDLDRILELDGRLLELQRQRDELKAEQNRLSKSIPGLSAEERPAVVAKSKEAGARIKSLEQEQKELRPQHAALLLELPNLADPAVPEGMTAEENPVVRTVGEMPAFDFDVKDHLELGEALKLIEVPRAVRIAGSRTYFLKGDLLLLELAVLRYALNRIMERGYLPMSPPLLVSEEAMQGTGHLPIGRDQCYEMTREDGFLIGTSETPVTALHGGEILDGAELPLRYAGYSPCFRREAGTYGKDTRGLYRVHQFMKVEQVIVAPADEEGSARLHEEILANAESVLQDLKIPYRVVALCGGDLGRSSAFTYDVECWMPGRNGWGETHSASRYGTFQARRLSLRYRDGAGKVHYCHTLNNTVVASPRILVALMENYQQSDGTIRVPDVLVPLVGKDTLGG